MSGDHVAAIALGATGQGISFEILLITGIVSAAGVWVLRHNRRSAVPALVGPGRFLLAVAIVWLSLLGLRSVTGFVWNVVGGG